MIFTPCANEILKLYTAKINEINFGGKCYLGFSTTVPNADGSNFKEPTNASYARIQLNINEATEWTDRWGEVSGGVVTNAHEVTSPECKEEGGWPSLVFFGIFSEKEGGTPSMGDYLTDPDGEPDEDGNYPHKPLDVAVNHVAVFRKGTLRLKIS